MLKQSFKMSLPAVIRRHRHHILESGSLKESLILFVHIKFEIREQEVQGYLALIMDLSSIEQLRSLIGGFLKTLNSETD